MLAERQGLLKGDLNIVQRAMLSYVIAHEHEEEKSAQIESFRQRMLSVHPEHAEEILDLFERIESGDMGDLLSDEELEEARPLDATGLDEALAQMKTLGIGLLG